MTVAMRFAIDAMGGDHGLSVTVPAVLCALKKNKNLQVLLFGPAKALMLKTRHFPKCIQQRIIICNAPEAIHMADTLEEAMAKPASSLRLAIEAVALGRADACVSAGNVAAVTALSELLIPKCPGVTKTAFVSEIPTVATSTFMMDLGAHLTATEQDLIEYAFMGHYVASVFKRYRYPKVALLNVGKEDAKGSKQVQIAHQYLKRTSMNYRGFIEGHELFDNQIDVVVCDGTVGNICLKTAEGTANLVIQRIKGTLLDNIASKAMSFTALPMLRHLRKEIDPNKYNGALLVGLTKSIARSHGGADTNGFCHCIEMCLQTTAYNLPEKIAIGFQKHHLQDLPRKLAKYQ